MGKDKEVKKFEFNRKSIICLILVSVIGIMSGIFVGNFFIGGPSVDYSAYSEAELRDDAKMLSSKVGNNLPSKYKNYEIFEIAEYRMFEQGTFVVNATGKVSTIANQTISSTKAFENGVYFKESLSAGVKNVGERTYYQKGGDVTVHTASKVYKSTMTANYKEAKTKSYEDVVGYNGVAPDVFVGYIVSSKTVKNQTDKVKKVTLDDGTDGYQFELVLEPILSVLNYVKQMKHMSQLSSYPVFSDIKLTVTVDKDFRFRIIETLENYTVNYMGANAGCKGTLKEIFTYGGENVIPTTN